MFGYISPLNNVQCCTVVSGPVASCRCI